ncbi:hypothetical protein KK062_08420 [Fulvivirgaceae bacterium PWU5]|uniref:Uncharacterized protein n=1 Tax=Dawidia cretensis TaxID=2782350 RepID=A0AAP2DVC5_9BACT|nr:hypothetical protein [Dawidia cretensis]MBT1708245.1 hypothetical protein [Dawidia cretensis]
MTSSNTADLANLYLGQQYPPATHSSAVHESTRHWCQNTLWGQLLFFVRKVAARSAGNILNADVLLAGDKADLVANSLRLQVLQQIFEPLTEGLALFATYDSYPTPTQSVPGHLVFMAMAYSGLTLEQMQQAGIEQTEQEYLSFLQAQRVGGLGGIQHKSTLLRQPLDATKSPSLQGYLFVKSLQGMLADNNKKFWDPNIFLNFIVNFFYNDIGWFTATLRPNTRPEHIPASLAEYFGSRIGQLRMLPPHVIDQFERDVTDPSRVAHCLNMFTTEADQQAGLALHRALYTDLIQHGESVTQSRFFHRKYFRLFSREAYIEITREDRVLVYIPISPAGSEIHTPDIMVDGQDYRLAMTLPNPGNYPPIKAKGVLRNYRVMQVPFNTCVIFLAEEKLLYSHFLANWELLDEKVFLDHFTLDGHNDPDNSGIVKIALDVLRETDAPLAALHASTLKKFSLELNGLYRLTLSASCVPTELDRVKSLMKDHGFDAVLGHDEVLLDLLSFISLANAHNIYDTCVMQQLGKRVGVVFREETLDELCKRLQDKNIYLIRFDSEYTLSTGV